MGSGRAGSAREWVSGLVCLLFLACGGEELEGETCGPRRARVARVIDGDTVVLASGESVRYLLVDTPEISVDHLQCYGLEAAAFNRALVEGREVELSYDRECRDHYDRLLAYLAVEGRDVTGELLSQGLGRVLQIPPNGEGRVERYRALESAARQERRGLWGGCR